jgi:hypothetical protein
LQPEIYKILISLVAVMVGGGFLFGFFALRFIKGYDEKIQLLFARTEDLPAIREAITWLKNGKSK